MTLCDSASGDDSVIAGPDANRRQPIKSPAAAYPLKDAAGLLGICMDTAYLRARTGQLPVPAFRVGRRWYVSRRALDALLNIP
jgi:hypothetical protein